MNRKVNVLLRSTIALVIASCMVAMNPTTAAAQSNGSSSTILAGDIDGDLKVTWWDYQALKTYFRDPAQFSLRYHVSDSELMLRADVTRDGQITNSDLDGIRGRIGMSIEKSSDNGTPAPIPTRSNPTPDPVLEEPDQPGNVSQIAPDSPKERTRTRTIPGGAVPLTSSRLDMGVNLNSVTYYTPEWVFTNVMRQSMPWKSSVGGTYKGAEVLELNNGSIILPPDHIAFTLIYRGINGNFPAGRYICTYEGTGRLSLRFSARVVREEPGRLEVDVVPSKSGIEIRVLNSDPQDPVRNVKLWLPGYENSTQAFHPIYLERLAGFKLLRFMDWGRINSNKFLVNWSDRSQPGDMTYAHPGMGVPLEVMIDLCNTLNASPWLCVPHLATDDYVANMARIVRDRLKPGLTAHIEYSNEVWNFMFKQTHYARERGQALGLAKPLQHYYAKRATEIFKIWEREFGGTFRIKRVIGSQSANPWVSEKVLEYADTEKYADALAIAPYFKAKGIEGRLPNATVDDVIELCAEHIRGATNDRLSRQKDIANLHEVELIAYEGGQHLVEQRSPELTQLFVAANRDPRMYDLMTEYFNLWGKHGGGTFTFFNFVYQPNKHGSWGLLEYQTQPMSEAHKFRAVRDAMSGHLPFTDSLDPNLESFGVFD